MNRENKLVLPDLQLHPSIRQGPISHDQRFLIERQVLEQLACYDPYAKHMMEVKLVCNQRRNFINISFRKDYLTLFYHEEVNGIKFCYFMSDKLEPFVIITALHPEHGKIHQLTQQQVSDLISSIKKFIQNYHISAESYHYTSLRERRDTEDFVRQGGTSTENKSHSAHFHLKMRIATQMMFDKLPVTTAINLAKLREHVEPVRYNYSRECLPFNEMVELMRKDAV